LSETTEHATAVLTAVDTCRHQLSILARGQAENIFIDFVSLYKTRIVIAFARKRQMGVFLFLFLIAVDIIVTVSIWCVLVIFLTFAIYAAHNWLLPSLPQWKAGISDFITALIREVIGAFIGGPFHSPGSSLIYASLVPSLWFITFVFSVWFSPIIAYMKAPFWFFDIDNHPIRSIGSIVAVTICTLVIIGKIVWSII
jgi:hypothetical protein